MRVNSCTPEFILFVLPAHQGSVLWTECLSSLKVHVEALIPSVTLLGGGALGRKLGLMMA